MDNHLNLFEIWCQKLCFFHQANDIYGNIRTMFVRMQRLFFCNTRLFNGEHVRGDQTQMR